MINIVRNFADFLQQKTGIPFRHLIKFGMVGSSGIIVNMGIFYIMNEIFQITYQISSPIAIEASILWNFFFNSLWTWRDRKIRHRNEYKIRFLKYHLITGFSALINYAVLLCLVEFFDTNKYLANFLGITLAMGINFIANHKWTFRSKHDAK